MRHKPVAVTYSAVDISALEISDDILDDAENVNYVGSCACDGEKFTESALARKNAAWNRLSKCIRETAALLPTESGAEHIEAELLTIEEEAAK